MNKDKSKQINIKVSAGDAKIIKEVIELEKSNVEAYRIATNGRETKYEKVLDKITTKLFAL